MHYAGAFITAITNVNGPSQVMGYRVNLSVFQALDKMGIEQLNAWIKTT